MKWWDALVAAVRGKRKPVAARLSGSAAVKATAAGSASVRPAPMAPQIGTINGGGRGP